MCHCALSYVLLGHLALRVFGQWVLRWGIIFSRGFGDNSLFFSLCGRRSGVFMFDSVLLWRHA